MHVDALDAAAALAGIVEGAVDQVLDGVVELGVGADIGRVLAAELEAERREGPGRCALDLASAGDRAGEVGMVDEARAENAARSGRGQDEVREHALGQAGLVHRHRKRSPARIVCVACLRMTALPAMSAGTMVLTAVR